MCQLEQKHFSRGVSAQEHAYCPAKETRRARRLAGAKPPVISPSRCLHRVPAFVLVFEPGTTPAPNDLATALQRDRVARLIVSRANSYLRDTPRLMRFFLDDQVRGSELPLPAHFSRSQVSASLHHLGHVASGVLAHGTLCCMCQAPARP
jgi:hypothetical protein